MGEGFLSSSSMTTYSFDVLSVLPNAHLLILVGRSWDKSYIAGNAHSPNISLFIFSPLLIVKHFWLFLSL